MRAVVAQASATADAKDQGVDSAFPEGFQSTFRRRPDRRPLTDITGMVGRWSPCRMSHCVRRVAAVGGSQGMKGAGHLMIQGITTGRVGAPALGCGAPLIPRTGLLTSSPLPHWPMGRVDGFVVSQVVSVACTLVPCECAGYGGLPPRTPVLVEFHRTREVPPG
jgi:hypothetical protein